MKEKSDLLNKILLAIIAGLLLVILIGTIIGLVGKKKNTPEVLISQGKAVSLMARGRFSTSEKPFLLE